MNKFWKTVLITIGIIEVFGILAIVGNSSSDRWASFGLINLLGALLCFFLGLLFLIFRNSRDVGKGVLLASLIVLMIGFSVCSSNPVNFH